jgi:tRNA(adenine34) deaminase
MSINVPRPPVPASQVAPNGAGDPDPNTDLDHWAMGLALEQAELAGAAGEVPIGAVVVVDGKVVAAAHNRREATGDPTGHAEILALRAAGEALGTWRLDGATLVVTLEPCPMCAGAAVAARLGRIVYGAADPKAGAVGSLYNLAADPRLNHEMAWQHGVRADECASVLTEFFADRR